MQLTPMKLEDEIVQKNFRSEAHKLGVNIIFTFNWINNFHNNVMKKFGLTSQQFNIMRILRGQHPNPANIKLLRERMLDLYSSHTMMIRSVRKYLLPEQVLKPPVIIAIRIKVPS